MRYTHSTMTGFAVGSGTASACCMAAATTGVVGSVVRTSMERKKTPAQIRVLSFIERSPRCGDVTAEYCSRRGTGITSSGALDRMSLQGLRGDGGTGSGPVESLNDRAVAHPSTGCGSSNNSEEQKTACKKVTGGTLCRQPALPAKDLEVTPVTGVPPWPMLKH